MHRIAIAMMFAAFTAMSLGSCGGGGKKDVADPDDVAGRTDGDAADPAEDEIEDGLELEGTKGHIDPNDAQPVIERSLQKIAACWQEKAAKQRWLGGHVEIKALVDKEGVVTSAYIVAGDLGSWPVEKCLIAQARALEFPAPRGGKQAEVVFPVDFPTQGKVMDMDEQRTDQELGPKLAELDVCAQETGAGPESVSVTLYVGPGGAVTSAGFASGDAAPFDEAWGDCALEKALAWKLSDPHGIVWKASAAYQSR